MTGALPLPGPLPRDAARVAGAAVCTPGRRARGQAGATAVYDAAAGVWNASKRPAGGLQGALGCRCASRGTRDADRGRLPGIPRGYNPLFVLTNFGLLLANAISGWECLEVLERLDRDEEETEK